MKKLSKRLLLISLPVIFICAGVIGLVANELPPAGVMAAAQTGIANFAKAGESGSTPGLKVAKNSVLGFGFQVYTVKPETLLNSSDLKTVAIPTETWRFVVKNVDNTLSLITVARLDNRWQAVSIGAAGLAAEIEQVNARWPEADGYSVRFIRIFQAKSDFIEVTRGGKLAGYVPLAASRHTLKFEGPFDAGCLKQAAEILPSLQDIVYKEVLENREK